MKEIKISIVIPVYDSEKTIERCIKSITEQDFRDIEVICVDDNSNDDSLGILNRLSLEDERIIVISNKTNKGTMISRKEGVLAARGEYIMFSDSDDWYKDGSLQYLYDEIKRTNVDILLYGAIGVRDADFSSNHISDDYIDKYNKGLIPIPEYYEGDNCILTQNPPDRLWNKIINAEVCKMAYRHTENMFLNHAEDTYASWLIHYFAKSFKTDGSIFYVHTVGSGMTTRAMTLGNYEKWVGCRKHFSDALCRFLKYVNVSDEIWNLYLVKNEAWFSYCINVIDSDMSKDNLTDYIDIMIKYYGKEKALGRLIKKRIVIPDKSTITNSGRNRLLLYVFYDKEGIVDDYVVYQLEQMKKIANKIIVICQGEVKEIQLARFCSITTEVIVRENKGYDVGAWKDCMLNYLGWNEIEKYDDLILMNDSCYGPIYPIEEMFLEMDNRNADFWGITQHFGRKNFKSANPYGYMPKHIQSYFICYRKKVHSSDEFRSFWENLAETNTFRDAVDLFETVQTKFLRDNGFAYDVYIDSTKDIMMTQDENPTLTSMDEMLIAERNPFLKKKSLTSLLDRQLVKTNGALAKKCIEYVSNNTDYDVNLIYNNVIRLGQPRVLYELFHLDYFLPYDIKMSVNKVNRKVAFIIHLFYEEQFEYCYNYLQHIPDYGDVYITFSDISKSGMIRDMFGKLACHKLELRLVKNIGKDLSALLVGARDVFFKDYDYICFIHDKMSLKDTYYRRSGEDFRDNIFECMLKSEKYIDNILNVFDKDDHLGVLLPPYPISGYYLKNVEDAWGDYFDIAQDIKIKLGLRCDLNKSQNPISIGTAFWCRPDALRKMVEYPWTYDDFDKNNGYDGDSYLHSLERIFEFVAQDSGYYTGVVMPIDYAELVYSVENYLYIKTKNNEIKYKNENRKLKNEISALREQLKK